MYLTLRAALRRCLRLSCRMVIYCRVHSAVQGCTNVAGAGMRTTAWMQEVKQRRSSCRGATAFSQNSAWPKAKIHYF